jgi:hypothetical protein
MTNFQRRYRWNHDEIYWFDSSIHDNQQIINFDENIIDSLGKPQWYCDDDGKDNDSSLATLDNNL